MAFSRTIALFAGTSSTDSVRLPLGARGGTPTYTAVVLGSNKRTGRYASVQNQRIV